MIDVRTTNLSFLQISSDLKKRGIKNNKFFLKLFDTTLQGVNPYDDKLTKDQQRRIIMECIRNPWYFIRECSRLPEEGGTSRRFLLNRANLATIYLSLYNIDTYLCIPRQIGKTQSVIALLVWLYLFGTTNSEMMFFNKRLSDANKNLSRMKAQIDCLPKFLQMKVHIDLETGKIEKNVDNVQTIKNLNTNNSVVTKPSATSMAAAEEIGRGGTSPIQQYDEIGFTKHIKTIVASAGPAFKTASDNAIANNSVAFRSFTSTPPDLDSEAGKDETTIFNNTAKWSEEFYDWTQEQIKEYLINNSSNRIMYIEYTYQQLGKDEEWFRDMFALINDKMRFKREVLLMRLHGSSMSPFDQEDLEALHEMKGKVIEEEFLNQYFKIDYYEPIERNRVYFVGVDVGNGYGEDSTAFTVWDPYKKKTVGEFKSPLISVKQTADLLVTLVRRKLPKAIVIIERNNTGEAVIDMLRHSPISHTLYWDNSKAPSSNTDDVLKDGILRRNAAMRRLFGVWTDSHTRPVMMDLLFTYIRENKSLIVGQNIISDIMTLVRKNDKIQAAVGEHDDSIMSYLMCLYVFYYGNNLERFGFEKGYIPSESERNQGFTYKEIVDELPEDVRDTFVDMIDEQEYSRRIMAEIQSAKRSYNEYGEGDSEYDEELDLSLFDELNKPRKYDDIF